MSGNRTHSCRHVKFPETQAGAASCAHDRAALEANGGLTRCVCQPRMDLHSVLGSVLFRGPSHSRMCENEAEWSEGETL